MRRLRFFALCGSLALLGLNGCEGSGGGDEQSAQTGSETEAGGDGDGEPGTGDGDGDPSGGDGDGDPSTGDGDGDPTSGDGDGDPTSGDGDGDSTSGDGDGDSTSGDGDGDSSSGDGDGDPVDDGFGQLFGECGGVLAELDQPTPSLFNRRFDFADDPYDDPEDLPLLTEGAQTILTLPNAGGSSTISEAFAFEVLARCEGAALLETETEIDYEPMDSKKTDFVVELGMQRVGVSVTRAVGFPPENPYEPAQALDLLDGKLADILVSSANVVPEQAWVKQILVIMAYADMHAESLMTALEDVDPAVRADTVVYVVVTDGMDTNVYFN